MYRLNRESSRFPVSADIARTSPSGIIRPDGPLAQLVEQRTLNPLVVGSIPTRPTKDFKGLAHTR